MAFTHSPRTHGFNPIYPDGPVGHSPRTHGSNPIYPDAPADPADFGASGGAVAAIAGQDG